MAPKLGVESFLRITEHEYDFAKMGGAIGDITLRGPKLPVGALVPNALIYVENAVTAGGAATVALKLQGANDILAATAIAGMTAGARILGVPDFATIADAPLVSGTPKNVVATVGAFALTGGRLRVYLFHLVVA
jgi:hypothetical protein